VKLRDWISATDGMTQEKLASSVGCSQPTIVRIINGGNTTTDLAKAICKATGWSVTLDDLLIGERAA